MIDKTAVYGELAPRACLNTRNPPQTHHSRPAATVLSFQSSNEANCRCDCDGYRPDILGGEVISCCPL